MIGSENIKHVHIWEAYGGKPLACKRCGIPHKEATSLYCEGEEPSRESKTALEGRKVIALERIALSLELLVRDFREK